MAMQQLMARSQNWTFDSKKCGIESVGGETPQAENVDEDHYGVSGS
jgi:hypothetical protein